MGGARNPVRQSRVADDSDGSSRPRPPSRRPATAPHRDDSVRARLAPQGRPTSTDRFRQLDRYRVEREWRRLEGTPQRDLFRELRFRFLSRHVAAGGWAVDIGSGPGRFAPAIGDGASNRVLLDISIEMLREARRRLSSSPGHGRPPELVLADARALPLREDRCQEISLFGNVLGFSGARALEALASACRSARRGGTIVLEIAPSGGERSRYLARLPPGAVRRLLVAPVNLIRSRVEREGFRGEPGDGAAAEFERLSVRDVELTLAKEGFSVEEAMAVAPALGADPDRIAAVRGDPAAWRRLLELEEVLGRSTARLGKAAAVLIAGRRV